MMHGENKETNQVLERIPNDKIGVEIGVWKANPVKNFY